MKSIPSPPYGSSIQVDHSIKEIDLTWKRPENRYDCYTTILFILSILAGLIYGWSHAGYEVINWEGPVNYILLIWLIGCTAICVALFLTLYRLITGLEPERIRLTRGQFEHRKPPPSPVRLMSPWSSDGLNRPLTDHGSMLMNSPEIHSFPLNEMPEMILERVDGRLRLRYDDGAERVEIGPELNEPEKEWLHDLLRDWSEKKFLE